MPRRTDDHAAARRVIRRMIHDRGSTGRGAAAFTRVPQFPPAPDLRPEVRAQLDALEPLRFGGTHLWAMRARTAEGVLDRVVLVAGRAGDDHPIVGMAPQVDARSLLAVAPSPHAPPAWICAAAWDLPVVHEVTQVRFTTRAGTSWMDAWTAFPVFLGRPEGVRWDDVVDVALVDPGGRLRAPGPGLVTPPVTPQPVLAAFSLPDDDPLWGHPGSDAADDLR